MRKRDAIRKLALSAGDYFARPFAEFARLEAAGGILLLLASIAALIWANTYTGDTYTAAWETHFSIALGPWSLDKPLHYWINDGLMAVFFFVVGLEIKREILSGELSSARKAALPLIAALGGMIVPALIFVSLNLEGEGIHGWGIPVATDIAFALGILSLLGKRAPLSLKVFLTALAIADDLGAVLVIAIFYTEKLSLSYLGIAFAALALLAFFNWVGVRAAPPYIALGIICWLAMLDSGVHATVAGVLVALTIPSSGRHPQTMHEAADADVEAGQEEGIHMHGRGLLEDLEHDLHPWVTFAIMPLFALANAGVAVGGEFLAMLGSPVAMGASLGLFFGKQAGVFSFSWLSVRLGLAELPSGVSFRHIYGAAILCGIGFTMSLFIAGLAFGEGSHLDEAKVGILTGSLVSAVAGLAFLSLVRFFPKRAREAQVEPLG
ncbi:MAG: Na+/H+ antiporter NhaA [bacterium]|jgi:NhaA family Na+:H+ antiporter